MKKYLSVLVMLLILIAVPVFAQDFGIPAEAGLQTVQSVEMNQSVKHEIHATRHWKVEDRDSKGNIRWVTEFDNMIVDEALNKYLTCTLISNTSCPYSEYVALVQWNTSHTNLSCADTAAQICYSGTCSTPGQGGKNDWIESAAYSDSTRPAYTLGAVTNTCHTVPGTACASDSNTGSVAVFHINATDTIAGAFLAGSSTKGGTTTFIGGTGCFSGTCSSGNSRSVQSGDTLNITITTQFQST